ncbi:MAG: hypothetical protein FWC90_04695 [Oscillospiraceae bacterium]|nr:hypothetical protein [Oscillospiraceae bacterium]
MKKKIFALAAALVLMLTILTACAENAPAEVPATEPPTEVVETTEPEVPEADAYDEVDEDEAPPTRRGRGPVRGLWEGNVFTSEYLGLRFVMPFDWSAADDADIAGLMGVGADVMAISGIEIPGEFWDMFDLVAVFDMVAANPLTGTSVQIVFERLMFPLRGISTAEYVEATVHQLERAGISVNLDFPGTVRIGDYDWYSFGTVMEMPLGMVAYGRQFINVQDGFGRIIGITGNDPEASVNEVLAMIISLDDPIPEQIIPEAVAAEHTEALVGTWAWDEDGAYTYVFYADGRGTRGFPWMTEEFEWRTEGDDHLMITTGISIMVESWTFTISDDVLTIDSRQVPGLTFNYHSRQPADA